MRRFLCVLLCLPALAARAELLFVGDFETGNLDGWVRRDHCCVDTVAVVGAPEPVRAGRCAVRHRLRHGDGKRAELRPPVDTFVHFEIGAEYWLGWSVFLPSGWRADDASGEIILQLHTIRDRNLGETFGRRPTMAFLLERASGAFRLYNRWDSELVTRRSKTGIPLRPQLYYALEVPRKGDWTDYALHIGWSYEDDGFTELYRDGELVLKRAGPNTYNDQKGPYLKFGIYKSFRAEDPVANVSERTIYYDEIRIGDAASSLAEVSPAARTGGAKGPCPGTARVMPLSE